MRVLFRLRLFDFADDVGRGQTSRAEGSRVPPAAGIDCIGQAGSCARAGFYKDRMTGPCQCFDAGRHDSHPVLVVFDLSQDADIHDEFLSVRPPRPNSGEPD